MNNHYEADIKIIEKFDPNKVWSAALYDEDQQGFPYIKRFTLEQSSKKQSYLGDNKENKLILLSSVIYPRIQVVFGGNDGFRDPLEMDVDEFIGVKSFKAKGKRITTFTVDSINELEPLRFPEKEENDYQEDENDNDEEDMNEDPDKGKSTTDIIDEITGQMKLFDDEE